MRIIAFAGPSIAREAVEAVANVECRPPVSQGDVYRAAKSAPDAIAIIDGYFEGVPSVWHKEILWALSQGIPVYGASSMGALRAAELHPFGMQGVGEIFEAFRDGVYEDDDEVAVLHAPAELGYRPLSLAMVNARATIRAAEETTVIGPVTAAALEDIAKSVFYARRDWPGIIRQARDNGIERAEIEAFAAWLPRGERDLKRADAVRLLELLAELGESGVPRHEADFHFEWTVMWDRVVSGRSGRPPNSGETTAAGLELAMLDELGLDPPRYRELARRAQLKQFALTEADRRRVDADAAGARRRRQRLRETHGLYTRAELDDWIERNDWHAPGFEQALENEQRGQSVMPDIDPTALLDELRLDGDYPALKAAALAKAASLEQRPADDPVPAQLLSWYFEKLRGEAIPAELDEYLATIGIRRRKDFYRMLAAHYHHLLAIDTENQ